MATNKVSYSSLKIKVNKDVKTFQFEDSIIEVIQYLPIKDKRDLIDITIEKSLENSIYNPIKLDMYFHLHMVYLMTNINFTEKQKEDEEKIYDALKSSGLLEQILTHIDENEYNELYTYLQEMISKQISYQQSFVGVASKIINDLPKNASAAMDIVNNFDKEQFSEVIKFAQAANGGRPIAELMK
jgi:hypothetical protein